MTDRHKKRRLRNGNFTDGKQKRCFIKYNTKNEKCQTGDVKNMRGRITYSENGRFGIEGVDIIKLPAKLYAAVAKLKDYENTKLSPDDVELLKLMYDDMVSKLDENKLRNSCDGCRYYDGSDGTPGVCEECCRNYETDCYEKI